MNKKLPLLLSCVTLAVGSGCISIREQMLKRGFDPSYVDGYEQGYASGQSAAGHIYAQFQKDTHRFERDSQYQQGWSDGFQVGKARFESIRSQFH